MCPHAVKGLFVGTPQFQFWNPAFFINRSRGDCSTARTIWRSSDLLLFKLGCASYWITKASTVCLLCVKVIQEQMSDVWSAEGTGLHCMRALLHSFWRPVHHKANRSGQFRSLQDLNPTQYVLYVPGMDTLLFEVFCMWRIQLEIKFVIYSDYLSINWGDLSHEKKKHIYVPFVWKTTLQPSIQIRLFVTCSWPTLQGKHLLKWELK